MISDNNGRPKLNTAQQWSDVVTRLLDKQGRPLAASTISERDIAKTVDLTKSEIKVAVPEGDWRVEVSSKFHRMVLMAFFPASQFRSPDQTMRVSV